MAILSFMTTSYAQNVYIYGARKFDGGVPVEYHASVKEHAATKYYDWQIKEAYDKAYITEDEYVETMKIKNPDWELPKPKVETPIVPEEAPTE
ncbi:hypothetical protein [Peribacillus loiseleuriae]|uniref:Uncharacterized protein n=1 Tax=Peribacillus loiseleuriae TaxID=1679170 RepID=A0A0K9GRC5_9BACI|nr:hypothetical protein [Peribacillus loiseleuriae]KMY49249.1 hypothetical protein AC625_06705 [Peribacillus loiseleuriae]